MTFDWNNIEQTEGNAELGGSSEPIPENTQVVAAPDDGGIKEWQGETKAELRWSILDGPYKGRKVFQKLKIFDSDPETSKKARAMLAAIDHNAGGGLRASGQAPTTELILQHLMHKPQALKLGVWDMNGNKGNWVKAVSPVNGAPAPQPTQQRVGSLQQPIQPTQAAPADDFDDGVPF